MLKNELVETGFNIPLHQQAQRNILSHRPWKQQCGAIESIHADAAGYEFHDEKLVLYMFNPFGPE